MNIFDHLNSKSGSQKLAIYSALVSIFVVLVLLIVVVLRKNSADIPGNFAMLLGAVIAAAFGTYVTDKKLNPVTDDTTPKEPGTPPPPP